MQNLRFVYSNIEDGGEISLQLPFNYATEFIIKEKLRIRSDK